MKSSKAGVYYTLSLICVLYLFDYADRMVVASLLPFIKQEWGSSDAQLGMLTGIVSLFVALFVLPLSVLVDRWSRKKMIVIMASFWSLATLACAFAKSYNELLVYRALTGLGEAAYAPAAVALISKLFPRNRRAYYTGIYDAFAPLGAGIGFAVGGYIGLVYGWRHAFGIVALPGLAVAIMFIFARDYATLPLANSLSQRSSLWRAMLDLRKIKTLWYVYAAYALNIGVNTSVMVWAPTYFIRIYGFGEKTAGILAGAIALMVLIGAPLGGLLSDRMHSKRKDSRILVSAISSVLGALFLAAALASASHIWGLAFFGLFGIATVAFLAPATAAIQDVVEPGIRAIAFGLNVVLMNILGAFLAPVAVGAISDISGIRYSLIVLPVLGIIAAAVFMKSRPYYLADSKQLA
jgi:MFS family permease